MQTKLYHLLVVACFIICTFTVPKVSAASEFTFVEDFYELEQDSMEELIESIIRDEILNDDIDSKLINKANDKAEESNEKVAEEIKNIIQEDVSIETKEELKTNEVITEEKIIVSNEKKEELVEEIEINSSSMGLAWKDSYTKALIETFNLDPIKPLLDAKIIKSDLEKIGCVNYNELSKINKIKFLVVYMSAIAEAESDYRTHITTLNKGDMTTNVGMLQIDVAAAKNHTKKALGAVSKSRLKDPHFNLKVGMFVLKNQILGKSAKGRFFPRRSYYWQVLTYPKRMLKTIDRNRDNISFCRR